MPLTEHAKDNGPADTPTGEKAKERKDRRLQIGVALAGVIVAYLTYRKFAASKAAAIQPAGNANDSGAQMGQNFATIEGQFAGIQQNMADLAKQETSDVGLLEKQQGDLANQQVSLFQQMTGALDSLTQKIAAIGSQQQATQAVTNTLSQASSDTAPSLPGDLIAKMQAGGESIVDVVKSTGGGWLYMTNKGGVYNEGGSPFFGSYLGYAGTTANPAGEMAAHGDFSSGHIVPLAGGHYEEFNNQGSGYTF